MNSLPACGTIKKDFIGIKGPHDLNIQSNFYHLKLISVKSLDFYPLRLLSICSNVSYRKVYFPSGMTLPNRTICPLL